MSGSRRRFGSASAALGMLALVSGCAVASTSSPVSPSATGALTVPSAAPSAAVAGHGSLVIVGRIVTMDEPPVAEALLIEDGTVTAVGSRDEVLALAGDQVPVMDIGQNVAYPGFIDAHAHWIGDREYYDIGSPAEAMDAALTRGWTSISEQWVNPERLDELEGLAAADALPLRVDAYLALNFGDEFLGDWYDDHERGPVGDRLRVQGLKIHLDNGEGTVINWEPADLTEAIGRANAGRLAGLGPHRQHRGISDGARRLSRRRSARPVRTRSITGSTTPSRCPTSSWPGWSRWISPR